MARHEHTQLRSRFVSVVSGMGDEAWRSRGGHFVAWISTENLAVMSLGKLQQEFAERAGAVREPMLLQASALCHREPEICERTLAVVVKVAALP